MGSTSVMCSPAPVSHHQFAQVSSLCFLLLIFVLPHPCLLLFFRRTLLTISSPAHLLFHTYIARPNILLLAEYRCSVCRGLTSVKCMFVGVLSYSSTPLPISCYDYNYLRPTRNHVHPKRLSPTLHLPFSRSMVLLL